MNQEPGLPDEVIMIFGDSEIVNRSIALEWCDSRDPSPSPANREQLITHLHFPGRHPGTVRGVAAFHPEGMPSAGVQWLVLALDADFQKLVVVRWSQRRDALVFQLASGPVTGQNFVPDLDRLNRYIAMVSMDRRPCSKAQEAAPLR